MALDIQPGILEKLSRKIETWRLSYIRLVNAAAGAGKVELNYFDHMLLVTVLGEIPNKHAALVEV